MRREAERKREKYPSTKVKISDKLYARASVIGLELHETLCWATMRLCFDASRIQFVWFFFLHFWVFKISIIKMCLLEELLTMRRWIKNILIFIHFFFLQIHTFNGFERPLYLSYRFFFSHLVFVVVAVIGCKWLRRWEYKRQTKKHDFFNINAKKCNLHTVCVHYTCTDTHTNTNTPK